MRFLVSGLVLITLLLCANVIAAYAQYDSLYYEDRWRTYLVHLPPQYATAQDTLFPLILALHGGFGSAYNLQDQSRLSQKADTTANPFIVVYPEGVKRPQGFRSWNAGACCGYARDENIDDVGFISVLIDTLINRYEIDENWIFTTGMSNGGMLSYRLAAELTNRIAAIAPVASTMVLGGIWAPTRPMPIIHFHSYQDSSVPFYGGEGNGFSNEPYPPADSVLSIWSHLDNCADEDDTLFHEVDEYLFKTWSECDDNADIHLYVTYDGGHSWPGGEKGWAGADPPSEKINANNLMWDFFQAHPADDVVSIPPDKGKIPRAFQLHQNYPNPFNPHTTIRFQLDEAGEVELSIYKLRGQKVRTLVSGIKKPGNYEITWNGKNHEGAEMASGVYLYRIKVDGLSRLRKMVLVR